MHVIKRFPSGEHGRLVSRVFDEALVSSGVKLNYDSIELELRDRDVSLVKDYTATICLDYNNPLVLDMDEKGIGIIIRRELFRLMFKFNLPRPVEDVIIGRELVKRGFGDDLLYMYYNIVMRSRPKNISDYIAVNIPWIIFRGYDDYNSDLMKKLAGKVCSKKFPETKKLFDMLCNLSQKNMTAAGKEYEMISCR